MSVLSADLPSRSMMHQQEVRRKLAAARTGNVKELRALMHRIGPRLWRVAVAITDVDIAGLIVTRTVARFVTAEVIDADDVEIAMLRYLCRLARQTYTTDDGPLGGLPAEQRACFVLTQLGRLTDAEAAMVCDIDVEQVRQACAAARDSLAMRLPSTVSAVAQRSGTACRAWTAADA